LGLLTLSAIVGVAATQPGAPRSGITAGQPAPVFHANTVDKKAVNFPADYKGKVVLLDFWATWCGPCRQELPNVVAAYNQFHDKGFEIVSVSLDRPRQGPDVLQFVKDHNMTWPQIYDGGYWQAAVAVEYGVHAIPCPVLVDGDTGIIIATDRNALGHHLTEHLEKILAAKNKK
jgi:thiol-disulfide isomerase/thioredoxin